MLYGFTCAWSLVTGYSSNPTNTVYNDYRYIADNVSPCVIFMIKTIL